MSTTRVLVVEDEEELVEIIEHWLVRKLGAEVDSATDGRAGLERASARPYDLILSDIRMPEMDGIAMVQQIRSGAGPNRATPVVILTGHHDEGREAASQLHARFVGKPFSRALLLEAVQDLLPTA
jgi:two-component system response regulator HydG